MESGSASGGVSSGKLHDKDCEDPILRLVEELRIQHEDDWGYKFDLYRILGASAVVWIATTAIAILLPVMYLRASSIISQFDVMGRWLVTLTRSSYEYLTYTARVNNVYSYSNFPPELGVPDLGLPPWYRWNTTWDQSIIDIMATSAEELHRCVVFGCAEEDVPGVSTSPKLEQYFFGDAGIDEGFKTYIQQLRIRGIEVPIYNRPGYKVIRDLPRLYAGLFDDWALDYVTTLVAGMGGVLFIVTVVFIRYYYTFVHEFAMQTRRYRFVLSLLPDRLVTQIPLFTSFMVNTEWVEPPKSIETDVHMLLGDEDDKI